MYEDALAGACIVNVESRRCRRGGVVLLLIGWSLSQRFMTHSMRRRSRLRA